MRIPTIAPKILQLIAFFKDSYHDILRWIHKVEKVESEIH